MQVRRGYEGNRERRRKFDVAHYGRNINTLAEEEEEDRVDHEDRSQFCTFRSRIFLVSRLPIKPSDGG